MIIEFKMVYSGVIALEYLKSRLYQTARFKLLLFVFLCVVCCFIFWTDFKFPTEVLIPLKHKKVVSSIEVRQAGCVVPRTPIFPDYFKKNWHPGSEQDCNYERTFVELQNGRELVLMDNASSPCCVTEVLRGVNDTTYNLTECTPMRQPSVPVRTMEAIFVKCTDGSLNAEAVIPIKDGVLEKLDFWKGVPEPDRPFSVLLLGFDSVSRSHAWRSIPKTLDLMKRMGFVDFKSYHSIAPSTLTNMMGFLMGLTRPEVRGSCAKDWETPFDDCPFIWKDFHDANYLTLYLEDGPQTFNWGGQSGFAEPPTDYYLHHFFLALETMRSEQVQNLHFDPRKRNVSLNCVSRKAIPEFMLDYNSRFLKKFSKFPFFAFTWFNYPFHDDVYSLSTIDDSLTSFFQSLDQLPRLLENTIIILLSDHGDRTSFFNSMSLESYIERGLPPLFIRLPNKLNTTHPEMAEALASNSARLTTPFDIHHTLLHILSMNPRLDSEEWIFDPVAKDRSSLLVPLNDQRNCSSTNIPAANCLCNIQSGDSATNEFKADKNFKLKGLKFVIDQLNFKVKNSEYKSKCEKWYSKNLINDVIYARKIGKGLESPEFIFAFQAWPGQAKFEARLVASLKPKLVFKKVIGFARINRYGDQSWCVGTSTDSDKEMKELCICKENQ